MATSLKPEVSFAETFDALDIRVGRIVDATLETRTRKPTCRLVVDFGRFGRRVSYGRFTRHPLEALEGRQVLGLLNVPPRRMGPVVSEALILGVQYPGAESGEAAFVSPAVDATVGSKLF